MAAATAFQDQVFTNSIAKLNSSGFVVCRDDRHPETRLGTNGVSRRSFSGTRGLCTMIGSCKQVANILDGRVLILRCGCTIKFYQNTSLHAAVCTQHITTGDNAKVMK